MCKGTREVEAKATGANSIGGYVGKVEGFSWVEVTLYLLCGLGSLEPMDGSNSGQMSGW